MSIFLVLFCIFFCFCFSFPWFSEPSLVALTVLSLCLEFFLAYFSTFFCVFFCFMVTISRFPGFQNLSARLENLTDSRLLPQGCDVSGPSSFCAARLQRPRGHWPLSASALKRSICGLGNQAPCILDPEILFGRGQQLPSTLHPMTSRRSPSQEPQTASRYPCYSYDGETRNHGCS